MTNELYTGSSLRFSVKYRIWERMRDNKRSNRAYLLMHSYHHIQSDNHQKYTKYRGSLADKCWYWTWTRNEEGYRAWSACSWYNCYWQIRPILRAFEPSRDSICRCTWRSQRRDTIPIKGCIHFIPVWCLLLRRWPHLHILLDCEYIPDLVPG